MHVHAVENMFTDIDEDGIIQDALVSKGTAPDVLLRSVWKKVSGE